MAETTGEIADARVEEGNRHFRAGRIEEAILQYRSAIVADAGCARAHYNLALCLCELSRSAEAVEHFRRAVEADPRMTKAFVNWGNVARNDGDIAEAKRLYELALSIDPDDPHALNNLASIEFEAGRITNARSLYERAIVAGSVDASVGLGNVFLELSDPDRAIESYRRALAGDPNHVMAHFKLGFALCERKQFANAIDSFERAIALDPGFAQALVNLGDALVELGDRDAAMAKYRAAIALDPHNAQALNNLALIHWRNGELAQAKSLLLRAVEARPEWARPVYNLSLVGLSGHEFEWAWQGYERRFDAEPRIERPKPCLPRWQGEDIARAGRLLIRKEQGVGDQIMFSTLLPELSESNPGLLVEVDARLLEPYRRSLPRVRFCEPRELSKRIDGIDAEMPIGSLAMYQRRSLSSFHRQPHALLASDPQRLAQVRDRLPEGRRIGVSWRSFRGDAGGARKSMPLEAFSALEGCGAVLVDLQYGDVDSERTQFDERYPTLRYTIPELDLFNDLDGILAAIHLCDLVVTTSNVTAHLAGSIGKRTWLVYLNAVPPFHYWAPRGDGRSIWYPGVEIMTSPDWSIWDDAMAAVARRWREEFEI